MKEGDVYDLGKINQWIEDLEEIHNNLGYVNFNMEQNTAIRDTDKVDVTFKINERDQVYVNQIDFTGNTTTRDKVLRREVLLREGDVFRLHHFRNSMLRVNQLGFFRHHPPRTGHQFSARRKTRSMSPSTVRNPASTNLIFGLGFSEFPRHQRFFELLDTQLPWQGRANSRSRPRSATSRKPTMSPSPSPGCFDKPRGLTARIFNTRTNFEAAGFNLESAGFQLGMSFRPSIFSTYSINYKFSEDRFPQVTSPAFKPVDDLLTSSVTQGIVFNTTDHPFFPKTGRRASVQLELAGWQGGGDNYFYKVRSQFTQYLPAFKDTFIGFNLEGGLMETLEDQRPTQTPVVFSWAVRKSVRGYNRRSLGPTIQDTNGNPLAVLGDKSFRFNFEYIIPISDQFRFVIFYDMGMIYGIDEKWFDTDFARSTGVENAFQPAGLSSAAPPVLCLPFG